MFSMLLQHLHKEHMQALEQLQLNDFDEIYSFVSITDLKNSIALGNYCEQIRSIAKFQIVISRYLQHPCFTEQVFGPDFMYPKDFISGFLGKLIKEDGDSDHPLGEVEDVLCKVKLFFAAESDWCIFPDETMETFSLVLLDRLTPVLQLSMKMEDESSPRIIILTSINVLFVCKVFWSLLENCCDKLKCLSFDQQLALLSGGDKEKYLHEKQNYQKEMENLQKQLLALESEYENKLKCHEKAIIAIENRNIVGMNSVFNRHEAKDDERLEWNKEQQKLMFKKSGIKESICAINNSLQNLQDKYMEEFVQKLSKVNLFIHTFASEVTKLIAEVFTNFYDCFCKNDQTLITSTVGSEYLKSEEFYNTLYFTDYDHQLKIKDLKETIFKVFEAVYLLKKDFMLDLAKYLGNSSELHEIIEKISLYVTCSLSSIGRSLHVLGQELKETKGRELQCLYSECYNEVAAFMIGIKNDEIPNLTSNNIVALIQVHEKLKDLCSKTSSASPKYRVNILHLKKFFSKFIVYCIQTSNSIKDPVILSSQLVESGLSFCPVGERQVKILLERMCIEFSSIHHNLSKVSIYALAEELHSVWSMLSLQPGNSDVTFEDEVKQLCSLMVKDLINISSYLKVLTKEMLKLIISIPDLDNREFDAFHNAVMALEMVFNLSYQVDVLGGTDISLALMKVTSEYASSKTKDTYGCCFLFEVFKILASTIQERRGNLKSRMQVMVNCTSELSNIMVKLCLNYSFYKALQLVADSDKGDVIIRDIYPKNAIDPQTYIKSAMFRKYCYHALKEIIDISKGRFKKHLFSSSSIRFEKFVLTTTCFMQDVFGYLQREDTEIITVMEANRELSCFPNAEPLNINFYAGCVDKFIHYVMQLVKDLKMNTYVEEFKLNLASWNDATYTLFTMREQVKSSSYEQAKMKLEKEKIDMEEINSKRLSKYHNALKTFNKDIEMVNELILSVMKSIYVLSVVLSISDRSYMVDFKTRFHSQTKRFCEIIDIFRKNKTLPKHLIDNDCFEKSTIIVICFQKICISSKTWKKVRKLFEENIIVSVTYKEKVFKRTLKTVPVKEKQKTFIEVNESFFLESVINPDCHLVYLQVTDGKENIAFHGKLDVNSVRSNSVSMRSKSSGDINLSYSVNKSVEILPKGENLKKRLSLSDEDITELTSSPHIAKNTLDDCEKSLEVLDAHRALKKPEQPQWIDVPELKPVPVSDFETECQNIPIHIRITDSLSTFYLDLERWLQAIMKTLENMSAFENVKDNDLVKRFNNNSLIQYGDIIAAHAEELRIHLRHIEALCAEYKTEMSNHQKNKFVEHADDFVHQNCKIVNFFMRILSVETLQPLAKAFSRQQVDCSIKISRALVHFQSFLRDIFKRLSDGLIMLCHLFKVSDNILHSSDLNDIIDFMKSLSSKQIDEDHKRKIQDLFQYFNDKKSKNQKDISNIKMIKNNVLQLPVINVDPSKLIHSNFMSIDIAVILSNDRSDPCFEIDLGVVLKGIGQGSSPFHLIMHNNTCEDYEYVINSKTAVFLPSNYGLIKSNDHQKLSCMSNCKMLTDVEFREPAKITLKSKSERHFVINIKQTVKELNPEEILCSFAKESDGDRRYFVLDIGRVGVNRKVERSFELTNPYNIPLRIKFVSSTIEFGSPEVLLMGKEKVNQKIMFTTSVYESSEIQGKIYFSEKLFYLFYLRYESCKVDVEFTVGNRLFTQRMTPLQTIPLVPGNSITYSSLAVRNKSQMPLLVTIDNVDIEYIKVLRSNTTVVSPLNSYRPLFLISANMEINVFPNVKINIKEMDGNVVKSFILQFEVSAKWPVMDIQPERLIILPTIDGQAVEKLNIRASEATLHVSDIYCDNASFSQTSFELAQRQVKTLEMKINPPKAQSEFMLHINVVSNCQKHTISHNIKCSVEENVIICDPEVIDLGGIQSDTTFSLLLSNQGNKPFLCNTVRKIFNTSELKVKCGGEIRVPVGEKECIELTFSLSKNLSLEMPRSFSGIVRFGQDCIIPIVGYVDTNRIREKHPFQKANASVTQGLLTLKDLLQNQETRLFATLVAPLVYSGLLDQNFSILEVIEKYTNANFKDILSDMFNLLSKGDFKAEFLSLFIKEHEKDIPRFLPECVLDVCDRLPCSIFSVMLRFSSDVLEAKSSIKHTKIVGLLFKIFKICIPSEERDIAEITDALSSAFSKQVHGLETERFAKLFVNLFQSRLFKDNKIMKTISLLLQSALAFRKGYNGEKLLNTFLTDSMEITGCQSSSIFRSLQNYLKECLHDQSIVDSITHFADAEKLKFNDSCFLTLEECMEMNASTDMSFLKETLAGFEKACARNKNIVENCVKVATKVIGKTYPDHDKVISLYENLIVFPGSSGTITLDVVIETAKAIFVSSDLINRYYKELQKFQLIANDIRKQSLTIEKAIEFGTTMIPSKAIKESKEKIIQLIKYGESFSQKFTLSNEITFEVMLKMAAEMLCTGNENLDRANRGLHMLCDYGNYVLKNPSYDCHAVIETATKLGEHLNLSITKNIIQLVNEMNNILLNVQGREGTCSEVLLNLKCLLKTTYSITNIKEVIQGFDDLMEITNILVCEINEKIKIMECVRFVMKKYSSQHQLLCLIDLVDSAIDLVDVNVDDTSIKKDYLFQCVAGKFGNEVKCNLERYFAKATLVQKTKSDTKFNSILYDLDDFFGNVVPNVKIISLVSVFDNIIWLVNSIQSISPKQQLLLIAQSIITCIDVLRSKTLNDNMLLACGLVKDILNSKDDRLSSLVLANTVAIKYSSSEDLKLFGLICNNVLAYRHSVLKSNVADTKELFIAVSRILSAEPVAKQIQCSGVCYQFCKEVLTNGLNDLKLLDFIFEIIDFDETLSCCKEIISAAKAVTLVHHAQQGGASTIGDIFRAVMEMKKGHSDSYMDMTNNIFLLWDIMSSGSNFVDIVQRLGELPGITKMFDAYMKICLVIYAFGLKAIEGEDSGVSKNLAMAEIMTAVNDDFHGNTKVIASIRLAHFLNAKEICDEKRVQFLQDILYLHGNDYLDIMEKFQLYKELMSLFTVVSRYLSNSEPPLKINDIVKNVLSLYKLLDKVDAPVSVRLALETISWIFDDKNPVSMTTSIVLLQLNIGKVMLELQNILHSHHENDLICVYPNDQMNGKDIEQNSYRNQCMTVVHNVESNPVMDSESCDNSSKDDNETQSDLVESEIKMIISGVKDTHTIANMAKEVIWECTQSIQYQQVILILSYAFQGNLQIEMALDRILHGPMNKSVSNQLPEGTLENIIQYSYRLYQSLQITDKLWAKQKIQGNLRSKIPTLKKQLERNLHSLVDCVYCHQKKTILAELEKCGIKLKSKSLIDDYVIQESNDYPIPYIQNSSNVKNEKRYRKTDVKGNITISNFKEMPMEHQTQGLNISWRGRNFDEKEDFVRMTRRLEKAPVIRNFQIAASNNNIQSSQSIGTDSRSGRTQKKALIPESLNFTFNVAKDNADLDTSDSSYRRVDELSSFQKKILMSGHASRTITQQLTSTVAEYKDPEELPMVEADQLRYPLLARLTKGLQSQCFHIMKRIKDDSNTTRPQNAHHQTFKFVFLVDNSGSMNGDKMTLALNILVVFLETMKRLEYKTAVVRFGGEKTQMTLKSFDKPMDPGRGQYIIESFDASEKTLPVDALKYVAETPELYGNKKAPNEHRFILLITDGIWGQKEERQYHHYLGKADAGLLIFTTHPKKDINDLKQYNLSVNEAKKVLDSIAPNAWVGLDAGGDINYQLIQMATQIDKNLQRNLQEMVDSKGYLFSEVKIQGISDSQNDNLDGLKYRHEGDIEWGKSEYVSDISKSAADVYDDNLVESYEKIYNKYESKEVARDAIIPDELVRRRGLVLEKEEESMADFIQELETVIDLVAFPSNRPTRTMQDYHGPSFSIKGFIKFLCTDGQYKKIYENMIGHPRKDYLVSVIIDVSASMAGMAAIGSIRALIGLAVAFDHNNMEFQLLASGSSTSLIKSFDQNWDLEAKARVYEALTFTDDASNLSDAVLYATFNLHSKSSSNKTQKTIFILTDGYAAAPKKLKHSLAYAESIGIQTIALGSGYFSDAIFEYFENYVVVGNPDSLPDALRQFYCGEGNKSIPDDVEYMIQKEEAVEVNGKSMTDIEEIWNENIRNVFDEQVKKTKKALYLAVHPARLKCNTMTVDLCFILDSTGSMTSHIDGAKRYIRKITTDVSQNLEEKCGKTARFRVAFVTYKARTNVGHLQNQHFTEDISRLEAILSTVKSSGGRGDEDKYDGIELALTFKWESTVKFCVLVGDMPGNADRSDVMPNKIKEIAKKNIYLMYVTITSCTESECQNFRQFYNEAAAEVMKKTGFTELDIRNGDTEKLKDLITGRIDDVICSEFL